MTPSTAHLIRPLIAIAVVLAWSLPVLTQAPAPVRLQVATGSTAGYRVNEQLARLKFPNDAVGTTESVSGVLVVQPDGSFSNESKLTVDLRTLKSDEPKRDGYLRQNTLETDKFPFAEFVPKRHKGLTLPLPASGAASFQMIGDMLLHGVTSEVVWSVTSNFTGTDVAAKATTRFPFKKFNLTIPRIFGLISVTDDIRLELDVRLRRATS